MHSIIHHAMCVVVVVMKLAEKAEVLIGDLLIYILHATPAIPA